MKSYRFIDPPLEVVVGDATEMVLECAGAISPRGKLQFRCMLRFKANMKPIIN